MKRFKRMSVTLFVLVIAMGAITACGGGGGGGSAAIVTVTGIIHDTNGDPVEGALVTINSPAVTTSTDASGSFFADVEVGSHSMNISMGTYTIYQGNFTIPTELDLNLGVLAATNPYYVAGETWYKDQDGDLYADDSSLPVDSESKPDGYDLAANLTSITGDCDDTNAAVNPAATEVCNYIDDNCDSSVDEGVTTRYYADTDTDTYGNPLVFADECVQPAGYVTDNTDCNDLNAAVNPGATEVCNGTDDNCAGGVDEGVQITFYADADIDSYGNPLATTQACTAPAGFVSDNTDCDDTSAAVNPAATEVCNDIDDNCDGGVDEGVTTTFYADSDSDSYGDSTLSTSACAQPAGYVADNTDCDDTSAAVNPAATEVCNDIDDNCNGGIDEGLPLSTFYADSDSDSYGDSTMPTDACAQPAGYVADNTDCNDFSAAVNPAATEVCNDIDDNCDGSVDEGVTTSFYADSDVDTYGDPLVTQEACAQPAGYVTDNTDCDDTSAAVNPAATEVCNDIDDNCDGGVDEGVTTTFYADTDTDTFGAAAASTQACVAPAGYVTDDTDCDDTNAAVNPAATEVCNGIDDNCAGGIDEGLPLTTYYADSDTDTYGNPSVSSQACQQPAGYVTNNGDCDDTNDAINPAATEVCNTVDDNCNGGVDEGLSFDSDLDGYTSLASCGGTKDDCNDFAPAIHPGATEVCNGTDDNCDGSIDEGVSTRYYADSDTDTYGNPLVFTDVCTQPPGSVTDNTDCDDTDAAVNPAAIEIANDIDDNCDGNTDEGFTWYHDGDLDGYSNGVASVWPNNGIYDFLREALKSTDGDCNDSSSGTNPGEKNCYGNSVGGEVLIPAGSFDMGDYVGDGWSDELPVHTVTISTSFYMDQYEVTNAEYADCISAGACTVEPAPFSNTRGSYYGNSAYDNFPVIYVSWNSAAAYCSWQGKRLPTEAEWEYAARGGVAHAKYPWGNNTLDSGSYANFFTSDQPFQDVWVPEDTAPGGFYAFNGSDPNAYGLYDMAGNVHEWVSDWYSSTYYASSPGTDPENTTPTSSRSERGGAWISPEISIRTSSRHEQTPTSPDNTIGFRCVYNP